MLGKNNEFLGNVGADLTGSHLDVATGRDEVDVPGEGQEGDSDDDDDDDENGAGARAARQARAVKQTGGGGASDGGTAEGQGGDHGGGPATRANATAEGEEGEGARLDVEVKEMERNKLVRTFFRGLLKQWEMDLNERPDHVKRTVQGKLETKTQKQAKDYMRPLFKLCKQKVRHAGAWFGIRWLRVKFKTEGPEDLHTDAFHAAC